MGIYTKKGDTGMTDMLSGQRVGKEHPYIELLGTIDELTSHIGFVRVLLRPPYKEDLLSIQQKLILVMGTISNEFQSSGHLSEDIAWFEKSIDDFQSYYPPQREFITPGDDEISVRLDIARTKARQTERKLIGLKKENDSFYEVLRYFNRLSDYLYALARMLAFREKITEVIKTMDQDSFKTDRKVLLNLELAKSISEAVEIKASKLGCKVVVCIVNPAGNPLLIHSMDQAFIISFGLAKKKAYTSAALQMPTHELGELTKAGADFEGLEDMLDEEIVTLGGGYPIRYNNEIIGAIGVSGSTAFNDKELAKFGATLLER